MIDLEEIEKLAEEATQGGWKALDNEIGSHVEPNITRAICKYEGGYPIAIPVVNKPDAKYIAAMNPETARYLITRIRRLEAIREVANCLSDPYTGAGCSDRKKCRVCSALTEYNEWRKEKPSD